MTTFYDVIKKVVQQIADARIGVSTDGSTTTLVDTNLDAPNDYYNKGIILLDQPIPTVRKVTDWDSTTFTFTFPSISNAIVAGVNYSVVNERFPLDVLKMAVNHALIDDIGLIMGIDETLTGIADVERYALLDGVYDVRRVEIGEEDEDWKVNYQWIEELGELRFLGNKPEDGKTIRLHYAHTHEELIDLDDEIDPQIPIDLIVHAACVYCLQWRLIHVRENEPGLPDKLSFHESRAMMARSRNKVRLLNRDPILARF